MSERWGFDLSMEAVRLMRHTNGEWQEFAVQTLDGDNIEANLAKLVAKAKGAASVDIFLPREQILYTDVKITDDASAISEINAAMEGRTPYTLDELEIDWVATAPGTARVAAIARETLLEAEAFLTQGGLSVRAFSSLAAPEDFPRAPVFGEVSDRLTPQVEPTPPEPAAPKDQPAFSTGRQTSVPPPALDASAPAAPSRDDGPVVKVDDPTPVLQLPKSDLVPLNPGVPLPRPTSQPRVMTNVGAAAAERRAASLNAPPPLDVRARDRAFPTLTLAIIAAAMSIGIAIIIWAIVPTTPTTSVAPSVTAPETEIAAAQPETPAASPLPGDITVVSGPLEMPALPAAPVELAWSAQTAPLALAAPLPPTTALAVTKDPVPSIIWLEPSPEALSDAIAYVPVALVSDDIAPSASFDASTLATVAPVNPASKVASPIPPFDANAPERPEIASDAPAVFVEPDVALDVPVESTVEPTDETTELAALDPSVNDIDSVIEGILSEDAALPETVEPDAAPLDETPELPVADPADGLDEKPSTVVAEPAEAIDVQPDLTPTDLAAALPETSPRPRPGAFIAEIERQKFGGRTRLELSEIRPGARPDSAQIEALVARAGNPPSDLAVAISLSPRTKPSDFDAIVANGLLQQRAERQARALAAATPDTDDAVQAALAEELEAEEATRPQNSPRLAIPSSASVARQATIDEGIRLNRINLVGVFGSPSARRALVRLPSGRYVKVQVGDRVDGGTVAAISESALQYNKGGRTLSLAMPQG